MLRNRTAIIAVATSVYLVAGCATGLKQPDSEEMYIKGSALTKLSAAVESTVRHKNTLPDLSESDLLTLATRHEPGITREFQRL